MTSIYLDDYSTHLKIKSKISKLLANETFGSAAEALILANIPLFSVLDVFFKSKICVSFDIRALSIPFSRFISDILRAVFFLLVGIELNFALRVLFLLKSRVPASLRTFFATFHAKVAIFLNFLIAGIGGFSFIRFSMKPKEDAVLP